MTHRWCIWAQAHDRFHRREKSGKDAISFEIEVDSNANKLFFCVTVLFCLHKPYHRIVCNPITRAKCINPHVAMFDSKTKTLIFTYPPQASIHIRR
jgi:hypothetical protein